MLGAIIGDIVGSRWEFNPTNDYDFEWLSKENGFTADTICKELIDDTFYKKEFTDVSWDVLHDVDGPEECERMKRIVNKEKDELRELMKKRGKAREQW